MAEIKIQPEQQNLPGIDPEFQAKLQFAKPENGSKKIPSEAAPPNLGKALKVVVPDFSDPKRAKTCLEVDFPIVPVNALSQLEGNAGKPIYQMSKWWARRRSSVFRAMLIAAATQAPLQKNADGSVALDGDGIPLPDETEAAKTVWDAYYANHQKESNFKHLKVLDPFMGGGTTLVEGSRLGFQLVGVDLNPVAWFVVKNELACVDPQAIHDFFDHIETEVKPSVQPFHVTECPRGHIGRWYRILDSQDPTRDDPMPRDFDPLSLPPHERYHYRYSGPEVIYTFWAKHGPCSRLGCGHRTPVFRSPVIAEKKLGVKYIELSCKSCKVLFHAELGAARMAPAAEQVVLSSEAPFTEMSQPFAARLADYSKGKPTEKHQRVEELYEMVESEPGLKCPKCGEFAGQYVRDILSKHRRAKSGAQIDKKELKIQPPRNSTKSVYCYLLVDPDWFTGAAGIVNGEELGGYPDATAEATGKWYKQRAENLRLIEVRGRIKLAENTSSIEVPGLKPTPNEEMEAVGEKEGQDESEELESRDYGIPQFITLASGRQIDTRRRTARAVKKQLNFTCGRCGLEQPFNETVEKSGQAAPIAVYAVQGHCPACAVDGWVYGGRFFNKLEIPDLRRLIAAEDEWSLRRDSDLADFWPKEEIPESYMTHYANFALPKQGYTHWWKMFNSRQLLVHTQIARFIRGKLSDKNLVGPAMQALGAHQQYLRNQCMFAFWHTGRDHFAPHFGNPNYSAKNNVVEVGLWTRGYGSWTSTISSVQEGAEWARDPWEAVIASGAAVKSERLKLGDKVVPGARLLCKSSSELGELQDNSVDLIVTDPPFGDNIFYSDLSNFFYVWLRLALREDYPELFEPTRTPYILEALAPRLLSNEKADEYYRVRLAACWTEAYRVLKDGGLLTFTFHHSEDSQWAIVLESLFGAGFLLEQTFPIASDEQKGEGGQFGAKGTEYDIIHVCRKRLAEPKAVSWAKMRQWVKAELSRLKLLLAAYKANELSDADVRVILRGKALEFYSRHYGQVLTSEDQPLSIRHALGGINQLLDEGTGEVSGNPPSIVQPVAYQYLRLFTLKPSRKADDLNKSLFGTTIRQRDFEDHQWIKEHNRIVTALPISERFEDCRKRPRKEMKTEIDQAHFLIGAAMPDSGVNLEQELSKDTWMVRRSVDAVLEWYAKMAPEPQIRNAAHLARTILRQTLDGLRQQPAELDRQLSMFNDWDEL